MQAKLLRVLEEREVLRVGGVRAAPIDVRFVAATNRDLEAEVARGRVPRRISTSASTASRSTIPPLRERAERDRAAGARRSSRALPRTLGRARRRADRRRRSTRCRAYAWPGNIRELRNVIERALVLCDGAEIDAEHLPLDKLRLPHPAPRRRRPGPPARRPPPRAGRARADPVEAAERRHILELHNENGGNQTRVAKKLGIARGTLIERLKRYGIKRPQVDD